MPLPAPVEEDLSVSTGDDPAVGRAQCSDDSLSAMADGTVRVGQGGVWPWHHNGGDEPGVTPEVGCLSTSLGVRVTLHHPLPNPGNPSTEGGLLQGMVEQTLQQIVCTWSLNWAFSVTLFRSGLSSSPPNQSIMITCRYWVTLARTQTTYPAALPLLGLLPRLCPRAQTRTDPRLGNKTRHL